jgi:succinoglycan biosynthesis transport protein ExoP
VEQRDNNAISIYDLFSLFRRGLFLAIICSLFAASAAYYFTQRLELRYQARATVLATEIRPDLDALGMSLVMASPLDASSYRVAATSSPVLAKAVAILMRGATSSSTIQKLRDKIRVRTDVDRNSTLIHIDVTDHVPEIATFTANAVADALMQWDTGRTAHTLNIVIATLEEQITALDAQLSELDTATEDFQDQHNSLTTLKAEQQIQLSLTRALSNSAVGFLEVLEPATTPLAPISPQPLRNAIAASVLVFFLVYVGLLLHDAFNPRLRSKDELAGISGLPVLAEFPKQMKKTYRLPHEPTSYLRANVLSATSDIHPKVILVTSALAGEGKSSVALSLAASFAINKQRTLLVDADLRKPVLGRLLNINPIHHSLQKHLNNAREYKGHFNPACVLVNATESLDVVPSFDPMPTPAELLSLSFDSCLKKWLEDYDVIVIDTPPVLHVADALTIAPLCTGTVLVTSLQRTDRRQVREAIDTLQRLGAWILGVVAVRPTHVRGAKLASHNFGSGEVIFSPQGLKKHEDTMGSGES